LSSSSSLGLSSIQDVGLDLYWMREAELKHARIAMLAALGFIAQEKGLFMISSSSHNQIKTFYEYAKQYPSSIGFFLVIIGLAEIFSGVAITEGRKGDRLPGDYGFNPLSFGKKESTLKDLSLKEIRNGRLAMIAAAGILYQSTAFPDAGVLDAL
jgi:light-harvesting complex I chlorophyll a/b binding protein 1